MKLITKPRASIYGRVVITIAVLSLILCVSPGIIFRFELYFSAEALISGLGLGLFMVQGIVNCHYGDIVVTCETEQVTILSNVLPLSETFNSGRITISSLY